MSCEQLSSLIQRLESATQRLEAVAASGGGGGGASPTAIVAEYDEYIAQCIDPFVAASNEVKSDNVKQAAALVKQLALEQRKFLEIVAKCSSPTTATLGKLLEPLSNVINEIGTVKSKAFKDREFGSYVISINEGVMAFSWVTVSPAPAPFVKECKNAAQFYANKVLKECSDKNWVAKWLGIFDPLHDYVKKHHTTGTCWNKDGPAATQSSAPAAGPGGPPAPPPPPPAAPAPAKGDSAPAADVTALLQDLNKGAAVTTGLKKVTDDMKTHKNPQLRLQSAVPYKGPTKVKPVTTAKPKVEATKPPVCELQGKKWVVEYQNDKNDLVIANGEMKHTVYVFKCNNCTIQVKGKVNQIILDSCKKTGICFDTVVSGVEFVNCQSVKGQVTGMLPTASIEKTDGCQLYLNRKAINCQVITAKSSEMNICIVEDNGDYTEYPIIEQFRTTWDEKAKAFVTEVNAE